MSNTCLLGIFRIMAVLDGNFNVIVCFNFYTCFIEKNFINRKFFKNYLKNNILNICGLFAIQNTFLWIGNMCGRAMEWGERGHWMRIKGKEKSF